MKKIIGFSILAVLFITLIIIISDAYGDWWVGPLVMGISVAISALIYFAIKLTID